MNYKQNERIMQVDEETIIVGIDIASELHYARAFDWRGMEIGKVISFGNNLEGFQFFEKWIDTLKQKHKKTQAILGAEPTGHYWFALADYAKGVDMKLVLVNPFHVKRAKELDDNHPSKSDRKDPKTIAKLVVDGRYMEPYIPEGLYAELRTAVYNRNRIVKDLGAIQNRIERWLKIYFPEYKNVFGDLYGKASLIILENALSPEKLAKLGEEGINQLWRAQKVRAVGMKRAKELYMAACNSIGRKEGIQVALLELEQLIDDFKSKMKQHKSWHDLIETLCLKIPQVEKLLKIKGVGLSTIAGFFAEVGDVSRFETPKQIQKYAGLALKENSSGKHRGKTGISKRGRKRLRAVLFQVALPLVSKNAEFKGLHNYYVTRADNPLKKKQSLIAISNKLIRIMFGICTKGFEYDGEKMLSDIKRPKSIEVA